MKEMVTTMGHGHSRERDREERAESWELPFGEFPELDFHADAFSIIVEPCLPGETPRLETSGKSGKSPNVHVSREGNVVRVRLGFESGIPFLDWLPWGAASKIFLRVPANVHGRIHTGAGTVRVRNLDGCGLELVTDAGTIEAERIRGHLRLMTSAGTIDGDELAGSLDVETHAGTIKLSIAALDPGTHRVHTSAGTVRVDLARNIDVRVDANSNFGGSRVSFPSSPNARAILAVSSDAGSIRVRASDARPLSNFAHAVAHAQASEHGPYRAPARRAETVASKNPAAADANDAELDRVLQMVAEGKLSPEDAGEVLRALGHG